MDAFFGQQDWNATGEAALKQQLYFSQLGQALVQVRQIQAWRATNVFGIMFWMYNEIWPTGGWGKHSYKHSSACTAVSRPALTDGLCLQGSIEYGGSTPGQVAGGRWKPFQYLLKASAYADTFGHCALNGVCVVKHDGIRPFVGTVNVTLTDLKTGLRHAVSSTSLSLSGVSDKQRWPVVYG
jgi:hypothetical protein